MLEISVAEAIEKLATGVQRAKASDLPDIESRLFREFPSPIPPVASDIAYHIRSGLETDEIIDLWNAVFPADRNVWFDEVEKAFHFEAGTPSQPRLASRMRRRHLRISVRALMVVVLLVGAFLGWIVRSAQTQREAVAAITQAGGQVRYEWGWARDPKIAVQTRWEPNWLVDSIGVDYFARASKVGFFNRKCSDEQLAYVGRLPSLVCVLLPQTNVTDAGLAHLKGLTNLYALSLDGTQITDAGLTHLHGLTNLSALTLSFTRVTDDGLRNLKGLTNLSTLNLDSTQVSDRGLEQLKGLTNLSELDLSEARLTDAGLLHLGGLNKLSRLDLCFTHVTDAGLDHLNGLTKLTYLDLGQTQVTDAGLVHLKGLTNLSFLCLDGTQITDAGLPHLIALTNLSILGLEFTQVTDDGLIRLKRLPNLSTLDLLGTPISISEVDKLRQARPHLRIIR